MSQEWKIFQWSLDIYATFSRSPRSFTSAGPPRGWEATYISSYATMHPFEDFAETFAHFLHIRDAIDIAYRAASHIRFDGMQFRTDIGMRAIWRDS